MVFDKDKGCAVVWYSSFWYGAYPETGGGGFPDMDGLFVRDDIYLGCNEAGDKRHCSVPCSAFASGGILWRRVCGSFNGSILLSENKLEFSKNYCGFSCYLYRSCVRMLYESSFGKNNS